MKRFEDTELREILNTYDNSPAIPYQVEITTPQGTTLTTGLTQTTLTAQVWQNGTLLHRHFLRRRDLPVAQV